MPSLLTYVLGFVFFRILDILKPGPIGWADRDLKGASGTLFDDILAGVVAAGMLALAQRFF